MKTSWLAQRLVPVLLAGGVFLLSPPARATSAPDAWLTARAKLALFTANVANATMVHVDTIDGRVLLYGKVTSDGQKKKAGAIVRAISGVTDVANMLEVVNLTDLDMVEASDDRIQEDVESKLRADRSLVANHVHVKSVDKGAVLLSGDTLSLSDHVRAVESASRVPGVRSVASEIESSQELAAYETMPSEGGISEVARDSWLIASAKLRFLADPAVPALEVGVDASHDVVTLFGIVPSEKARSAAAEDVRGIDPNVTVKNQLQVVPATYKRLVDANDDLVKQSVEKALRSRKELRAVLVEVKHGVVRLTGVVDNAWQRLDAGLIARGTRGVRSVLDDLKV